MARRQSDERKYIRALWIVVLGPVAFLFLLVSFTAFGLFGSLPTFEELENPNSSLASEVYSADLKTLGKYYVQNRVNIHYKDLSPNLINALKATEDVRFEEHSGVDIKGLFRVFVKTIILQQDAGGGSTLTQQLAKNLFPREDMNKIRLVLRSDVSQHSGVREQRIRHQIRSHHLLQ